MYRNSGNRSREKLCGGSELFGVIGLACFILLFFFFVAPFAKCVSTITTFYLFQ